jgi:choline kinase
MRVELDGDKVRQIGKHVKMPRSHGEYAGVSLLRPPAARRYAGIATDWEWSAQTSGYYEDVYADMLDDVDCRAAFVRQDEYAEVDLPEDMTAAMDVVAAHRDEWATAEATAAEKV